MVDRFLDWLTGLPPALVYLVLAALSAVENVFPPVPADVAVLLGAFLGQRGVIEPVLLGLLCWAANTLSAVTMYELGRRQGEGLLRHRWSARLLPVEARAALVEAWERHGVAGIFLSRLLPGVRATVTPFAGMLGLPAGRVLVPAAVASLLWYAVLVAVGTLAGQNWQHARKLMEDANRVLALLAVVFVVAVVGWVVRRVRERRQAHDRQ